MSDIEEVLCLRQVARELGGENKELRAENERLLAENKILLATVKELENTEHGEIERLRELLKNVVGDVDDYIRMYAVDQARFELGFTDKPPALADQGKG